MKLKEHEITDKIRSAIKQNPRKPLIPHDVKEAALDFIKQNPSLIPSELKTKWGLSSSTITKWRKSAGFGKEQPKKPPVMIPVQITPSHSEIQPPTADLRGISPKNGISVIVTQLTFNFSADINPDSIIKITQAVKGGWLC